MTYTSPIHPNLEAKNHRIFQRIIKSVGKGEVFISRRGVPHVVIDNFYSVVRFGNGTIRVFDNYCDFKAKQKKHDFNQWGKVVDYLREVLQNDTESKSNCVV